MKAIVKKITDVLYKYRYDLVVFAVIVVAAIFFYANRDNFKIFNDRGAFQNYISGFGPLGPLAIILSIVIEVIVAPLPGYVPAITAGFIFGPVMGSVYTFIGNVIGSFVIFMLARAYGKRLVTKFLDEKRLEKYEKTISKHENYLLIFYFIPVAPIDIISAVFGLSKIRFKKFFLVSSTGFLVYSIVTTNFGDYLAKLWF